MPGSLFELVCPGCTAVHEMSTGADICFEHGKPWDYRQMICRSCQRIRSQAFGCHFRIEACSECGGVLEAWEGRVFFESTGDEPWQQSERIEGPCPACGATLHESDSRMFGLWD
jgi:hypothetical protein